MRLRATFVVSGWLVLLVMLPGCLSRDRDCDGLARLSITNLSIATEQAVQVDGIGYGTIFPGETIVIEVFAGTHTIYTPGVSGGVGCAPVASVVFECETQYFSCSE